MASEALTTTQQKVWQDGLPPDECWIRDPNRSMPTPTDARGLVDYRALFEEVSSYIDPNFLWPDTPSEHHLYWWGSYYEAIEQNSQGIIRARAFRNLSANKVLLPRMLHTVLHRVSIAPPIPKPAIMNDYVEGWEAASSLYRLVHKKAELMEDVEDHLARPQVPGSHERAHRHGLRQSARLLGGVAMHIRRLERIPESLRPIHPDASEKEILAIIGRVLRPGFHRIHMSVVQCRRGKRYRWDGAVY